MKRLLIIMMFLVVISMVSCDKIVPLENPEPSLFDFYQIEENFTILKRSDIDPNQAYITLAYIIQSPKGQSFFIGQYEMLNYMVLYDDDYYDLQNASYLSLFTADDLHEWNINVSCSQKE